MICGDCALAADAIGGLWRPPVLVAELELGHERCAARNDPANRAPGQLADCTCQHVVNAQIKESATP